LKATGDGDICDILILVIAEGTLTSSTIYIGCAPRIPLLATGTLHLGGPAPWSLAAVSCQMDAGSKSETSVATGAGDSWKHGWTMDDRDNLW
jgi:hypothetical protein